jgi:hypothetical protein
VQECSCLYINFGSEILLFLLMYHLKYKFLSLPVLINYFNKGLTNAREKFAISKIKSTLQLKTIESVNIQRLREELRCTREL